MKLIIKIAAVVSSIVFLNSCATTTSRSYGRDAKGGMVETVVTRSEAVMPTIPVGVYLNVNGPRMLPQYGGGGYCPPQYNGGCNLPQRQPMPPQGYRPPPRRPMPQYGYQQRPSQQYCPPQQSQYRRPPQCPPGYGNNGGDYGRPPMRRMNNGGGNMGNGNYTGSQLPPFGQAVRGNWY